MADVHAHSTDEKKILKTRIRKVAGQLGAIERMIDQDVDCVEVLTQVVSARKGLKSFAELVIREHVEHCIDGASNKIDGKRKLRELLVVLQRYVE
jgi:CsoR family transcriptional regulator, copper-sensing transcriptional repressor